METMIKRGRGRPRKEVKSYEDQLDDVILKAFNFRIEDGEVKLVRNSTPLSLEETAILLWASEGKTKEKPVSKMQIIHIERSAMRKVKNGLAKYGINSLDDIFEKNLSVDAEPV